MAQYLPNIAKYFFFISVLQRLFQSCFVVLVRLSSHCVQLLSVAASSLTLHSYDIIPNWPNTSPQMHSSVPNTLGPRRFAVTLLQVGCPHSSLLGASGSLLFCCASMQIKRTHDSARTSVCLSSVLRGLVTPMDGHVAPLCKRYRCHWDTGSKSVYSVKAAVGEIQWPLVAREYHAVYILGCCILTSQ